MTIFITSFPFFLLPGIRYFLAYLSCFFVITAFHVFLLELPTSLIPKNLFIFFSPYIIYFIDTKTYRTSLCVLNHSVIEKSAAGKREKTIRDEKSFRVRILYPALD